MTELAREMFDLMRCISARPGMYANSPQEAHGQVVALAWIMLREASKQPIQKCFRKIQFLIDTATPDVRRVAGQVPLLCDESSYPDQHVSFAAFQRHSRQFLDLLEGMMRQYSNEPERESEAS
jgi:hypothetical protein